MKRILLFGAVLAVLSSGTHAYAQMKLSPVVVAPGGSSSAGGTQMLMIVGQPVVGIATDSPIEGDFGFAFPVSDYVVGSPTAVRTFGLVDAHIEERSMVIVWDMLAAENVDGFNVYRRDGPDGSPERLNADPIPLAKGMSYADDDIRPGRSYEYFIGAVDLTGEYLSQAVTATVPKWKTELEQNYPNPFNPSTTIPFYLAETGDVSLRVYNVRGQLVRELVDQPLGYGEHEVTWDGTSDRGSGVASGVYFYRLITRGESYTRRMMILK